MYNAREKPMRPTDLTKRHVISTYVKPARMRGETTIQVRVGTVLKELGWTNRTPSVYSTLSSEEFRHQAGLELIEKRGGPPSGGPSTSWQFVFRVLDGADGASQSAKTVTHGGGLLALYGICADMYREVGGAEAFIRSQREDFGSIVPDGPEKTQDSSK